MVGRNGKMAGLDGYRGNHLGGAWRSPEAEHDGLGGHYDPPLREISPPGERPLKPRVKTSLGTGNIVATPRDRLGHGRARDRSCILG